MPSDHLVRQGVVCYQRLHDKDHDETTMQCKLLSELLSKAIPCGCFMCTQMATRRASSWHAGRAQVWDFITGKLKRDLQFQADEQFMMHDTAVLALAFSRDSELLASASQDGKVKVQLPRIVAVKAPSPLPCSR